MYEDKDEEEVNVSELKTILLHPKSIAESSSVRNQKSAENEKQLDVNTPKHHECEQQNEEKKGQMKIMREAPAMIAAELALVRSIQVGCVRVCVCVGLCVCVCVHANHFDL